MSQGYPIRDEEYLSSYSRQSLVKGCYSKGRCHPLQSSLMGRRDAVPGSRTWPEIRGRDRRDVESKDSVCYEVLCQGSQQEIVSG